MLTMWEDIHDADYEKEVDSFRRDCRSSYLNKKELLYLVHPGSNKEEGDPNRIAKVGCEAELRRACREHLRAILIYPLRDGVYIDHSQVTDIRGGTNREKEEWFDVDDLNEVSDITLVGGKWNRCLASIFRSIRLANQSTLNVRLPNNAIYGDSNLTIKQVISNRLNNNLIKEDLDPEKRLSQAIKMTLGMDRNMVTEQDLASLNLLFGNRFPNNNYDRSEYGEIPVIAWGCRNIYYEKKLITSFDQEEAPILDIHIE